MIIDRNRQLAELLGWTVREYVWAPQNSSQRWVLMHSDDPAIFGFGSTEEDAWQHIPKFDTDWRVTATAWEQVMRDSRWEPYIQGGLTRGGVVEFGHKGYVVVIQGWSQGQYIEYRSPVWVQSELVARVDAMIYTLQALAAINNTEKM